MKPLQTREKLFILVLVIIALEAIFFFTENSKIKEQIRNEEERKESLKASLDSLPEFAKAVSVYNIDKNQKIYGRNDEAPLPIASLAKIMTIVTALNHHNKNEVVEISKEAIEQDGDYGLLLGEKWNIEDLAKLTLINSVNDGAYAISLPGDSGVKDTEFLKEMNEKAKKIGAEHTSFFNVTGLDIDDTTVGALATAEDVNTMAIYAVKDYPKVFLSTTLQEITLTSLTGIKHNFKNTDTSIAYIPNIIFSKTGYTDLAGGNLCIIFKNKNGDNIAVTVLGSTMEGRFTDMESIVNILYNF